MSNAHYKSLFKELQCCVIVPTYNNRGTLRRVLDGVLEYTDDLLVANDGSTDDTVGILVDYPQLEQVHFEENQGKGMALRAAFKKARELGYAYAVTIDSDGQHFPSDLPTFLQALKQKEPYKEVLLIGARNMDQPHIPKKSSFGNKFSNFWFWFETGIKMQDTQSGYRLYPLLALEKLKFWSTRFEFEIEVIVKSAWEGIEVRNVPVSVLYEEGERVSHFRPWTDFGRISVMNTYLVLKLFFYIKPRNLYRRFIGKGFKGFVQEDLLGTNDPPRVKALSIALGVFIGIAPLWGLQTAITLGLAIVLRLNKALAFAASNVSIPPMIPFIILGSIYLGNTILGQHIPLEIPDDLKDVKLLSHLKVYIVGSLALATMSSIVLGGLAYAFLNYRSLRPS